MTDQLVPPIAEWYRIPKKYGTIAEARRVCAPDTVAATHPEESKQKRASAHAPDPKSPTVRTQTTHRDRKTRKFVSVLLKQDSRFRPMSPHKVLTLVVRSPGPGLAKTSLPTASALQLGAMQIRLFDTRWIRVELVPMDSHNHYFYFDQIRSEVSSQRRNLPMA